MTQNKKWDAAALYELYRQHPCITTDSRETPQGSIFIALKGETFDGNRYAGKALENGCAMAIVDNPEYFKPDGRYVLVDNCLRALQLIGREHRRQFNIPVIGITGTNGKTTTKELVSAVLAEKYNVLFTQGNFNNDIGVPKTLLRLNPEHEIAVVEMGASHPGDIKTLVELVEPQYGLITNVGKAHLQGFGSFEGVVNTKCELYDFLRKPVQDEKGTVVFVNMDNHHLLPHVEGLACVGYGQKTMADVAVRGRIVSCAPLLKFAWKAEGAEEYTVQTHLVGAYNIDNMLAAITIGRHFGVSDEQICHAIANYIPSNNRSQLEQTAHNQLVVDAYNANPSSMAAAIENFRLMEVTPKMAILGQMSELGESSEEEHLRLIAMLEQANFDRVWLVGPEFMRLTACPYRRFANVDEVKEVLKSEQPQGFTILVKGSNSTKLFTLPPLL